jgi:hypothetical protein
MNPMLVLAGAGGGVLRGVMGIAKDVVTKKSFEINWIWFFVSIGISAILGVIAASFFGEDMRLALLAGYVGADFIEGLMKIKLKNKFGGKEEDEEDKPGTADKPAAGGFGKLLEMMK